jgi:hypothetical protein
MRERFQPKRSNLSISWVRMILFLEDNNLTSAGALVNGPGYMRYSRLSDFDTRRAIWNVRAQ